ncbi:TonB-dependent receptor [Mucilaginibacter gynuensis]|uniref:TonB-dependent receptor n=1 Tax=Mucilaginibacter gynuensis TaxID=1302236 RepID=A0ABP8G337_9SPHI
MKKILTYTIMLMLIPAFLFAQQTGSIKTIVKTSDGQAAEAVSVYIKGTKRGGTTNENGEHTISNLKAGDYTILISAVGLVSQEKSVSVGAGQSSIIEVTLSESLSQLVEVNIKGSKVNKFAQKSSDYVARMPLSNLENPQVYNTVSSELIKEQVITNFNDALKNVPGIDKLWTSTGRGGDGAGYFSLRGFAVQPTLVNGLAGLTTGGLDLANTERIEVLKGPSGTLFGSSIISYGGLINIITKKPFKTFATEVTYTAGSFGLNRITADVNTPLDKEGNVLLRVNAAYHDENSFQDQGFKKTRFFAPTLSYKVDDKLSFLFNAEVLSAESTNPTMLFFDRDIALRVNNLKDLGYDYKKSYTSNNLTIKNPTTNIQAQMNYQLSPEWRSQTVVSRSTAKSDGYYSYLYETSQYFPGYPNIPSVFGRYINKQNATITTTDLQQNFIGDFSIAGMRNRIVAGVDYFSRVNIDNGTGYAVVGMVTIGGDDTGILSVPQVDSLLAGQPVSYSNLEQKTYSTYVSDVFNFTPSLSAMVSARIDHFVNGGLDAGDSKYSQTHISPKFGLVYQPIKDQLSLFANYMNGFTNVAPATDGSGRRVTFNPQQANQLEFGTKLNIWDNKIAASFSYYNIKVTDVVRSIGANVNQTYVQDGENNSKGFEADITANPVKGLNIIAGYSRNISKTTKTSQEDFLGRRPEEAGPKNMINAWISYRFDEGMVKGLGLGFGGNYASENQILNRLTTGVFALPAYTVLNASASYAAKAFTFTFKVDNLTNKEYYKGWSTLEAQRPRAYIGSIAYKF